jgi:hypothetical protein
MSREQTSANCETCANQWPPEKRTPKGEAYYVPVCKKSRNVGGFLSACTLARSIDGPCGPDARMWAAER